LWVIRTDPALNDTLKEPLIRLLQNQSHHLLIASNDNPNVQVNELLNVDPNLVWSGDLQMARQYLEKRDPSHQTRAKVLETRLDADDALHMGFVETLQKDAAHLLEPTNHPAWRIWCASRHTEWQYHAAWNSGDAEKATGSLVSLRDKGCISTGLTLGYSDGLHVHDLPPIKHDQLPKKLKSCSTKKTKCLDFVDLFPAALRARTPTSAGMLNILLKEKGHLKEYERGARTQEDLQKKLWFVITRRFGVTLEDVAAIPVYLEEHLHGIVLDNLKGQCTSGHSCKRQTRELLQKILDNPQLF